MIIKCDHIFCGRPIKVTLFGWLIYHLGTLPEHLCRRCWGRLDRFERRIKAERGPVKLAATLIVLTLVATTCQAAVYPTPEMQEHNRGSNCAHSSIVTMLRMVGAPKTAEQWRVAYRGPEKLENLARKAIRAGLPVQTTFRGDSAFLERVNSAVIDWTGTRGGHHAVVFLGFAGDVAVIYDPNTTIEAYPKAAFIRHWQRCSGRAVSISREQ